jgi:hypothetical protein
MFLKEQPIPSLSANLLNQSLVSFLAKKKIF